MGITAGLTPSAAEAVLLALRLLPLGLSGPAQSSC